MNFTQVNNSSLHAGSWSSGLDIERILVAVVLISIELTTLIGNLLVVVAVMSTKALHTVTNSFITSLAVADMLVAILVMPLSIYMVLFDDWRFGPLACDLWICCDVLLCTASILNLCCISLDRYLAITRPLSYSRQRSPRLAKMMIALVWIGSVLISCPPVFGWKDQNRAANICRLNLLLSYRIYSSMGSFYLPGMVMIFVYIRIFKVIHDREKYLRIYSTHGAATFSLGSSGQRQGPWRSIARFLSHPTCCPCCPSRSTGKSAANECIKSNNVSVHSSAREQTPVIQPQSTPANQKPVMATEQQQQQQQPLRAPLVLMEDDSSFAKPNDPDELEIELIARDTEFGKEMRSETVKNGRALSSQGAMQTKTKRSVKSNKSQKSTSNSSCRLSAKSGKSFIPVSISAYILNRSLERGNSQSSDSIGEAKRKRRRPCSSSGPFSFCLAGLANDERKSRQDGHDEFDDLDDYSLNGHKNRSEVDDEHQNASNNRFARSRSSQMAGLNENFKVKRQAKSSLRSHSGRQDEQGPVAAGRPNESQGISKREKRNSFLRVKEAALVPKMAKSSSDFGISLLQATRLSGRLSTRNAHFEPNEQENMARRLRAKNQSITSFTSSSITLKIHRGNGNASSANGNNEQMHLIKESKAAKTLAIVVGGFILCWLPFFIMYVLEAIYGPVSKALFDWINWLGYLNSAINPIIYAFYSKQFRTAFYRVTLGRFNKDSKLTLNQHPNQQQHQLQRREFASTNLYNYRPSNHNIQRNQTNRVLRPAAAATANHR
nr:G protein-coupled receptor [Proales similis]